METHVSSTTADVPDTQEVIGSHGNVEIVVAVEKVEEEILLKADSNSKDNAQPAMDCGSPPCSQSIKTDVLQKSPHKQDQSTGKEINKTAQSPIKLQPGKQATQVDTPESQSPQNKVLNKQVVVVAQHAPAKEPPAITDVDSTSPKDIPMDVTSDDVDSKNDMSLNISVDGDPSNESQSEVTGDASEKEHNKSISRELKSLINSAKESKIISECTKLTSKTRKSARAALDTSNTNINNTPEAHHIQGNRRSSSNSQKSNSSEKSDRVGKRSMRSQNPEFVHKVRKFLNSVTGKFQKDADSDESAVSDDEVVTPKIKENTTDTSPSTARNRNLVIDQAESKLDEKSNKLRSDPYCWRCHWSIDMNDGEKTPQPPLKCTVCPRAFHYRCLTGSEKNKISSEKNWVCPECMTVLHAESSETRSLAMRKTTLGMLCELLKYALQRMTEVAGSEPFLQSVDRSVFPDYDKYVVHPMDLALMKEHINEGLYGSTEAFLADAHWILHNSIIFNTLQSKLTTTARALVRSCRAEMGEIEACPECYAAAHARRATWFTDVCSTPHLLLWAKLKGFPYWPAKAMTVSHAGLVDVRFFGAHDRAWVPARDCYLYCERDPNNFRTKRQDMVEAMQEAEQHIRNISRKYGKFAYAPYRTTFEASKLEEALKYMIPSFDGQVRSPVRERRSKTPARALKSRSNSKGSKDDSNAGDAVSDSEAMDTETTKTADEVEKNEAKEGNAAVDKPQAATRKRTRSETKGPVASDSSPKEKTRRLLETPAKEPAPKKTDSPVVSSSKEVAPKQNAREDAAVEPKAGDAEVAEAAPAPALEKPSPSKTETTPKVNKNVPKTNNVATFNKTPAKSDLEKTNDKEKSTLGEKSAAPSLRNSRSNRQSSNIETVEIDEKNPATITPNKTPATPVVNPEKTNSNKIPPKESVTINKAVEKEKNIESAVLIKINDKSNKDASLTVTVNAKDKLTEAATLTKITDIVKMTHNKNKVKEKETESVTPNKDSGKDKMRPGTAIKTNAKTTPSSKNMGSEKSNNASPTVSANVTNNNSGKINAKDNTEKTPADKPVDASTVSKKDIVDKEKTIPGKNAFSPKPGTSKAIKPTKERIQYDEDTSLALIARKVPRSNSDVALGSGKATDTPGPPATRSASASNAKTTHITVEVNPDSSIFTPTSTDNVRNMKEAVNKLQKLRSGFDPPANPQVGKVGVRAFARMTSPPEKQAKPNDVVVEIKSEPMDYDDCDAQQDNSSVLDSLRPRPIAPAAAGPNLREVRISKVTPAPVVAKKPPKVPDVRPRAKKTFPQPKKADDGRAELTNKNSMVYIPIQPPISQSPVRAALKTVNSATATPPRTPALFQTANIKNVTSMAPPLMPMAPPPPPMTTATATSAVAGAILAAPAFPAVPTTVHTVPLITSVNGQWTFSLQPVMSVGAGETVTTATVNGVGERASPAAPPTLPVLPAPPALPAPPVLPAFPATVTHPPALVPTSAPANSPAADAAAPLADDLPAPPQLQKRPPLQHPLASSTEIGEITAPSSAGPLTAKLNHNSIKLAEFFRHLLEESLVEVQDPTAETAALRLQLEQERWRYQHELAELRRTNEVALVEIRAAMDKEKSRAVAEARRLAHQELEAAVKSAKSKQWCANCSQEAQFYCCWNTSYCDYPCQRAHWGQHYAHCTQQRTNSASPPSVTAKVTSASSRTVNSEQAQNKSPIAVSTVDEGNGHATSKNAGASPQPAAPSHVTPLLANKQLINNDEHGSKRVVTSGGFLIVGAGAADARRPRRD